MSRPTTIEDMTARLSRFRSAEAMAAIDQMAVRPSDVFICTYTKSGTTWMQQVVHQLRTEGSMDFDEISVVVPWVESALDMDIDPDADQPWEPRAFKSHLSWSQIPRGGRYITVFRDPRTVLPSFHRFFEGWFFEPDSISLEEFARGMYLQGSEAGRHWHHFVDWWPRVGDSDVLVLAYEDMTQLPDRVPGIVADFLGIKLDPESMGRVIENCSRATMTAHGTKFEEQLLRRFRDPVMGLPPGDPAAKVNPTASSMEPGPDLVAELDRAWAETVERALGFSSYHELRRALPNPLGADRH